MATAMSVRFDERLAERTRVARELHDTFLQTVQASKLVADHALRAPEDNVRMLRTMEQLSAWLGRATEEGRAALNSLRASTVTRNDMANALRRAIDECRGENDAEISLIVTGDSREMHPLVRDEVYRIAYEAIRNACLHSGAARIEISLIYTHDLIVRVSDHGRGIDRAIIEHGRDSHFGLQGMKERAERITGALTVATDSGSGTVVTLLVPGRVAFLAARHWWQRRTATVPQRHSGDDRLH
jgi:signal transduction histidine kinase